MTRSRRSFPPPDDAAARYDAVLRRGRSLRRRRQLEVGAGAGGALLAAGLAVVLVLGRGEPSSQVVAVDPPSPAMVVQVAVDDDPATIDVTVENPVMISVGTGRQCVLVQVEATDAGQPVRAEGYDCGGTGDGVERPLAVSEAMVGCAASQEREPYAIENPGVSTGDPGVSTGDPGVSTGDPGVSIAAPTTTGPPVAIVARTDEFRFDVPELPPGRYEVTVMAASGSGDGCDAEERDVEVVRWVEDAFTVDG